MLKYYASIISCLHNHTNCVCSHTIFTTNEAHALGSGSLDRYGIDVTTDDIRQTFAHSRDMWVYLWTLGTYRSIDVPTR